MDWVIIWVLAIVASLGYLGWCMLNAEEGDPLDGDEWHE